MLDIYLQILTRNIDTNKTGVTENNNTLIHSFTPIHSFSALVPYTPARPRRDPAFPVPKSPHNMNDK